MLELALIAQLAGPRCGWYPGGIEITPENSPYVGCTVPNPVDPWGTRLRRNPMIEGGVIAVPAGPEPLTNYTP